MRRTALVVALLLASAAFALHPGHGQSAEPYAGQQSRDIKALSDEEMKGYLTGAGMGFAKAAELNRYPGPVELRGYGWSGSQRHNGH